MFVKICGITRLEDAEQAVVLGADAVGFICWPKSRRYIDPEHARQIVAALPPFVTPLGVFVNQRPADVNAVADRARFGAVQLHGDEDGEYVAAIERPVLKALALDESTPTYAADLWPARVRLLLDVADPVRRGGTGRTVDWTKAAAIALRRRVLLAGGLTPENIGEAVSVVRPFGVDVSSGIESAPGVKDHARMKALFEALIHAAGIHG